MAGIDKTYVKSWEDYNRIKEWCLRVGQVTDDYGNKFSPIDWFSDYTKEDVEESLANQRERYARYFSDPEHVKEEQKWQGKDWKPRPEEAGEIFVWNTPAFFDVWLIRYCPLQTIQERLKQQYASSYTEIKERRSDYDIYIRPAASSHFSISRVFSFPKIRGKKIRWEIEVDYDSGFRYSEETNSWHHWRECRDCYGDCTVYGGLGKRKLARLIKKWGFPADLTLRIYSNYGHHFEIKTR